MDTVALIIYYHEAALEAGSKFVPQNSPTVHAFRRDTDSVHLHPQNGRLKQEMQ